MAENVLFSSVEYNKYDSDETLPARFGRLSTPSIITTVLFASIA